MASNSQSLYDSGVNDTAEPYTAVSWILLYSRIGGDSTNMTLMNLKNILNIFGTTAVKIISNPMVRSHKTTEANK
jgi:hypothetical protein